jgi:hypothetical protein
MQVSTGVLRRQRSTLLDRIIEVAALGSLIITAS